MYIFKYQTPLPKLLKFYIFWSTVAWGMYRTFFHGGRQRIISNLQCLESGCIREILCLFCFVTSSWFFDFFLAFTKNPISAEDCVPICISRTKVSGCFSVASEAVSTIVFQASERSPVPSRTRIMPECILSYAGFSTNIHYNLILGSLLCATRSTQSTCSLKVSLFLLS